MIQKFEFKELDLKGAFFIQPFYATDDRGGFVKDYNMDIFKNNVIEHELKEVFYTIAKCGVIRAIHFQLVKQQAKLVRCISGHVYDVIVDLRPNSLTFGQWRGFDLTGENQATLYVPQDVYKRQGLLNAIDTTKNDIDLLIYSHEGEFMALSSPSNARSAPPMYIDVIVINILFFPKMCIRDRYLV